MTIDWTKPTCIRAGLEDEVQKETGKLRAQYEMLPMNKRLQMLANCKTELADRQRNRNDMSIRVAALVRLLSIAEALAPQVETR